MWVHFRCVGINDQIDAAHRAPTFVCPPCIQLTAREDDISDEESSDESDDDATSSTSNPSLYHDPSDFAHDDVTVEPRELSTERTPSLASDLRALFDEYLHRFMHDHTGQLGPATNSTASGTRASTDAQSTHSSRSSVAPSIRTPTHSQAAGTRDTQHSASSSSVYTARSGAAQAMELAPSSGQSTVPSASHPPQQPNNAQFCPPPRHRRVTASSAASMIVPTPRPRMIPPSTTLPSGHSTQICSQPALPIAPPTNTVSVLSVRQTKYEELPEFDGSKPEIWVSFEAVFNHLAASGYNDNELIAEISKAVTGRARLYIQDLLQVRDGPKAMMTELRNRYGNARKVLGDLTKRIEARKSPRDYPKEPLLDFALALKSLVTVAKAFNRMDYVQHSATCDRFVDKLKDEHQDHWRQMVDRNPDAGLAELTEYLLLKATDPSATPKPKETRMNLHDGETANDQPPQPTPRKRQSIRCFKCRESHPLRQCPSFLAMTADVREVWVGQNGICSSCLYAKAHKESECIVKRQCGHPCKCNKHLLLHAAPDGDVVVREKEEAEPIAMVHEASSKTLYKIIPVRVMNAKGDKRQEYALLDLGSNRTLIEKSLFDSLGLNGTPGVLKLKWTKNIETVDETSYTTSLKLYSPTSNWAHRIDNVSTVEDLQLPRQTIDAEGLKQQYPYLCDLPLTSYHDIKPSLLIGLQHAHLCVGQRQRYGKIGEPIAMKTPLGWALFGGKPDVNSVNPNARALVHECLVERDDELREEVERHFAIENCGVASSSEIALSKDDERAIQIMEESCRFIDGHYEVALPWRSDRPRLPNNYGSAVRRMEQFERSAKKKGLLEWVNERIRDMMQKGYVRLATPAEIMESHEWDWNLPIFVTINENKVPPKPRLVFDAKHRHHGVSLNSQLLTGPDLVTSMTANLCRLRERQVAVTGDIQEMYHQIRIAPRDQYAQRFLWRDGDPNREPTNYILQVMAFGTAPSSFCSQWVKNHHAARLEESHPKVARAIRDNLYVDDYCSSFESELEAAVEMMDTIQALKDGGFNLRSILSNCEGLLKSLPKELVVLDALPTTVANDKQQDCAAKILGVWWDPKEDLITFKVNEPAIPAWMREESRTPTKREVLRAIMRLYDPLGLVAHVTIRGKIIFQKIWTSGIEWDGPMPTHLIEPWQEWIRVILKLREVKIPRWYSPISSDKSTIDLHVFTDASDDAMAATGYFRIAEGENVHLAHVMAKVKVMPIKPFTIPRAELVAALMGARLQKRIIESHTMRINTVTLHTDSSCVIAWLKNTTKKLHPFVRFRVGEILSLTKTTQWRLVPGRFNVADDATKENANTSPTDTSSRWYHGPDFLLETPAEWPGTAAFQVSEDVDDATLLITQEGEKEDQVLAGTEQIDDWDELTKVVALRLREPPSDEPLTPTELEKAEWYLYKNAQQQAFQKEFVDLRRMKRVRKSSPLHRLSPFLDEGDVIRLQSRLQHSDLSYAARNPAILPKEGRVTDLMIVKFHRKFFHQGEEAVILALREKVWILNIKAAVRRVKAACSLCDYMYSRPEHQRMGDVPLFRRVPGTKAFVHVGMDVWGPFKIAVGRRSEVRWILIFTCLVTRAVHFEILEKMDTDDCLLTIQDFINLRGPCRHFYSDCGRNFVGADRRLKEEMQEVSKVIAPQLAVKHRIEWHFNPPLTPQWGGCWERLIGIAKRCLKAAMEESQRLYTAKTLRSALLEVMNRMNERPLMNTPQDPADDAPLTPNHFLHLEPNPPMFIAPISPADAASRMMYRRSRHLAEVIWAKFLKAGMQRLVLRGKWLDENKQLEAGHKVLMSHPTEPRETWKLATITATHPGRDGRIRVITVTDETGREFKRSVHAVVPLRKQSPSIDPRDGGQVVAANTVLGDKNQSSGEK